MNIDELRKDIIEEDRKMLIIGTVFGGITTIVVIFGIICVILKLLKIIQ